MQVWVVSSIYGSHLATGRPFLLSTAILINTRTKVLPVNMILLNRHMLHACMFSSMYPDQVSKPCFISLFLLLSFRPSCNHDTWILPANTHTCSNLRCHKYFISTILDGFIDSCAGAKFKTLEMPKWHGAEFDEHCNTIILFVCPSVSLCLFQNEPMARLSLTVRRFTSVFLFTLCLSLLSYGHDVVLPR